MDSPPLRRQHRANADSTRSCRARLNAYAALGWPHASTSGPMLVKNALVSSQFQLPGSAVFSARSAVTCQLPSRDARLRVRVQRTPPVACTSR